MLGCRVRIQLSYISIISDSAAGFIWIKLHANQGNTAAETKYYSKAVLESRAFRWSCMSCFYWKMLEHVLMGGFLRCCQGQTIWMSSFHMCLHYSSLSPCSWWAGVLCWMLQYPDQVLYSIIVNPRSIHACGSCISRGVVAPGVLEVVCRVLVAPAAAMSSASVRHLWGGNWR